MHNPKCSLLYNSHTDIPILKNLTDADGKCLDTGLLLWLYWHREFHDFFSVTCLHRTLHGRMILVTIKRLHLILLRGNQLHNILHANQMFYHTAISSFWPQQIRTEVQNTLFCNTWHVPKYISVNFIVTFLTFPFTGFSRLSKTFR